MSWFAGGVIAGIALALIFSPASLLLGIYSIVRHRNTHMPETAAAGLFWTCRGVAYIFAGLFVIGFLVTLTLIDAYMTVALLGTVGVVYLVYRSRRSRTVIA